MLPVADAGVPVEYMAKKGMAVVCYVLTRESFQAAVSNYSVGLQLEVTRLVKRVKIIRDKQRRHWEVFSWNKRQDACAIEKMYVRAPQNCVSSVPLLLSGCQEFDWGGNPDRLLLLQRWCKCLLPASFRSCDPAGTDRSVLSTHVDLVDLDLERVSLYRER